jgi:hypothetical protein
MLRSCPQRYLIFSLRGLCALSILGALPAFIGVQKSQLRNGLDLPNPEIGFKENGIQMSFLGHSMAISLFESPYLHASDILTSVNFHEQCCAQNKDPFLLAVGLKGFLVCATPFLVILDP